MIVFFFQEMRRSQSTSYVARLCLKALLLWSFVIVFVVVPVCIHGQTPDIRDEQKIALSPLFHLFLSNTPLQRPKEFREMHANIDSEIRDVKTGLRYDYLYEKMSDFRNMITREITLAIVTPTTTSASIDIRRWAVNNDETELLVTIASVKFDITAIQIQTLVDKSRESFNIAATRLFEHGLITFHDPLVRRGVAQQICELLGAYGFTCSIDGDTPPDSLASILVQSISSELFRSLQHTLIRKIQELRPDQQITETTVLHGLVIPVMEETCNTIIKRELDRISTALDRAEDDIVKTLDYFSRFLVSGNVGLALTRGTGDYAGGLHTTFRIGEHGAWFGKKHEWYPGVQIGTFIQTKFTGNSTLPGRWLIGLHGRLYWSWVQLDGIFSTNLGNDGVIDDLSTKEYGFGISMHPPSWGVVLALSSVRFEPTSLTEGWHSVGISAGSAQPESPVLMVGWSWADTMENVLKEGYPQFKIIFPIVPRL